MSGFYYRSKKRFVIFHGYIRIWGKGAGAKRSPTRQRCEIMIPKNQLVIMLQKAIGKKMKYNPITGEIF